MDSLRQLVDLQQYQVLNAEADRCWLETQDIEVLPLLVLSYAHLGDRLAAERALEQIKEHWSELTPDATVDLAGGYCVLQRLDQAQTLLETVLESQPDHSLGLARLAWCRVQKGYILQALALYQRSVELGPHRLPVWIALASLKLIDGEYFDAQKLLDSAITRFEAMQVDLPEAAAIEFTAQLRSLQLEVWVVSGALSQAEVWLNERYSMLLEDEWCQLLVDYSNLLASRALTSEAEDSLRFGLKHYPENISLLAQLAELAQLQGRSMQALQLLRRAMRLSGVKGETQMVQTIRLWVRLSSACLHQVDKQARHAAEKAIELAQGLKASDILPEPTIRQLGWQAKNALAQVESNDQQFEIAEALFREVLTEAPYFAPALQGLGHQQMQRGNIDEAVALFEILKQVDLVKGYSSLMSARRFPNDEPKLEKIECAARQPSLEGPVCSGLLLQLASAWEKRKDYDRAFVLAVEANEASKAHLAYDPIKHRHQCARIRHAFCKALYTHRRNCGYRGEDESLPVFVLGMPRSGTTLVEQILASHSQIFGAGELGVIPSRIQGLNRWERHTGSGRQYPDCIDELNSLVVEGIANGILDELKELAAHDKPEAKHIVDKLPHNFENIGLIKFLFPKAKIISVRRDPRDIAISNYFTDYQAKHGGMGFAYDLGWIGEQLADHNLLMHHWHQLFPGEILEINYEDVVENTEDMARKMLDYIGVDWEPQVLAFNELDRPVKTASVWQVRQPIYKTSKAKWMRYQNHLASLIQGTNAKITWEPIEDMLTLPTPGMLTDGVALYKDEQINDAEYVFKKLLHHIPDHAAANFMVGLIYVRKGHLSEGVERMEKALNICPWKKEWRDDLIKACELLGDTERAESHKRPDKTDKMSTDAKDHFDADDDTFELNLLTVSQL